MSFLMSSQTRTRRETHRSLGDRFREQVQGAPRRACLRPLVRSAAMYDHYTRGVTPMALSGASRARWTLGITGAALFMTALDSLVVGVALNSIRLDLGGSIE